MSRFAIVKLNFAEFTGDMGADPYAALGHSP